MLSTPTEAPHAAREGEGRRRRSSLIIIAKSNLERHTHTLSGDAGADIRSQAGGGEHLIKDLEREANSLWRQARPALLDWGGGAPIDNCLR